MTFSIIVIICMSLLIYNPIKTIQKSSYSFFEVPDVLDVHFVPSVDVRIVPEEPTEKKILFP